MKTLIEQINATEGFDWDRGNLTKNFDKHAVSNEEAEKVFKNRPLLLMDDLAHSRTEIRGYAFGKTDEARLLTISFTIRKNLIRVISARPMNQRERKRYEEEK